MQLNRDAVALRVVAVEERNDLFRTSLSYFLLFQNYVLTTLEKINKNMINQQTIELPFIGSTLYF